jgi:hypothetical protein
MKLDRRFWSAYVTQRRRERQARRGDSAACANAPVTSASDLFSTATDYNGNAHEIARYPLSVIRCLLNKNEDAGNITSNRYTRLRASSAVPRASARPARSRQKEQAGLHTMIGGQRTENITRNVRPGCGRPQESYTVESVMLSTATSARSRRHRRPPMLNDRSMPMSDSV